MLALFIEVFLSQRDGVGVVRRDGEHLGEEGLGVGVDASDGVLQEGLVEDAPHAVVVVGSADAFGLIFVFAKIFVEADLGTCAVEVHHTIVGAMEESAVVSVAFQAGGKAGEAVASVS